MSSERKQATKPRFVTFQSDGSMCEQLSGLTIFVHWMMVRVQPVVLQKLFLEMFLIYVIPEMSQQPTVGYWPLARILIQGP